MTSHSADEEAFFAFRDAVHALADALANRLDDGGKAELLALCKVYYSTNKEWESGADRSPEVRRAMFASHDALRILIMDGLRSDTPDDEDDDLPERAVRRLSLGLFYLALCDADPAMRRRMDRHFAESEVPYINRLLADLADPA